LELDQLEQNVRDELAFDDVYYCFKGSQEAVFFYRNQPLHLAKSSTTAKLLKLFSDGRYIEKPTIISHLYNRSYDSKEDDQMIYYHIHVLRKKIQRIGIPVTALVLDESGYRFLPKMIETKGGVA